MQSLLIKGLLQGLGTHDDAGVALIKHLLVADGFLQNCQDL